MGHMSVAILMYKPQNVRPTRSPHFKVEQSVKYLPKILQLVAAKLEMPALVILPNCPTVFSVSNN